MMEVLHPALARPPSSGWLPASRDCGRWTSMSMIPLSFDVAARWPFLHSAKPRSGHGADCCAASCSIGQRMVSRRKSYRLASSARLRYSAKGNNSWRSAHTPAAPNWNGSPNRPAPSCGWDCPQSPKIRSTHSLKPVRLSLKPKARSVRTDKITALASRSRSIPHCRRARQHPEQRGARLGILEQGRHGRMACDRRQRGRGGNVQRLVSAQHRARWLPRHVGNIIPSSYRT
jgi:hypothetical protein